MSRKKEPAFLMNRVSDEGQERGFSLPAQEKHGRKYCDSNGFEIIQEETFSETASKVGKRTKFDKRVVGFIAKFVAKSKVPLHLVVEKTDRLTRNYTSREKLQKWVLEGKLVIHYYVDKKIMDAGCSPADIFNEDIQIAVGKYTANNISRESKKGMKEVAEGGRFPGHVPMGYKNIRKGDMGKHGRPPAFVIVDPDERIVRATQRTFELRATTALSYRGIAKQVRSEDILPFERGRRFSKSTVEWMLKNEFYDGWVVWRGEKHKGNHTLIIPEEHRRAVFDQGKRKHSWRGGGTLDGFIKCAETACGCAVFYDPKEKTIKSTGEKRAYHYYHCTDGKQWHKDNNQKQRNISEEKIFDQLGLAVSDISLSEKMTKCIFKALEDGRQKQIRATKRNMEGYKEAIRACEKKEDTLCDHFTEGSFDKETYQRQIKRVRGEKMEFEGKLENFQNQINDAYCDLAKKTLELATNAETLWISRTPEERVETLKTLLSNPVLEGKTIKYEYQKPFKALTGFKELDDDDDPTKNTRWCTVVPAYRTFFIKNPYYNINKIQELGAA